MKQQHRIEAPHDLLDDDGLVIEAGYAYSPILDYSRAAIKAPKTRIKEWDYYMVISDECAIAFTLSDQTYAYFDTVGFMDFSVPRADTARVLPLGGGKRPYGPPGAPVNHDVKHGKLSVKVETQGDTVHITSAVPKFFGSSLQADITLYNEPTDHMVIVTPFFKPKHFYYNLKTNCIDAEGYVRVHGREYIFERGKAFACYDCGRGAWTRRNTWYWTTLSAMKGGHKFGMNLGYGFGDTSAASENMFFYDGKAHKLGEVVFDIPKTGNKLDFTGGDWKFTDEDGRLDMIFKPIVVRSDVIKAGIVSTVQNQTFGRFYGDAVLDDGTVVKLDGDVGACEVFDNNG